MQKRPKVIFGVGTAVGALIAATGLLSASPASAATTPTFNVPPIGLGWGDIVLTGTAAPNTAVQLRERAYAFTNGVVDGFGLEPSEQYFPDKPTLVRSDAQGKWAITRTMDSGFMFAVSSDGEVSRMVKAPLRVTASLSAVAGAAGVVDFVVRASPDQPGLEGVIQRFTSSGWVQVAEGMTDDVRDEKAEIKVSASGQPAGTQYYRALLQGTTDPQGYADAENLLLSNYSANVPATVGGSSPDAGPVPPGNPTPAVPADAVSPPAGGGGSNPSPSVTTSRPTSPSPSVTTSRPASPSPSVTTSKPPVVPSPSKTTSKPAPSPTKTTSKPTPKPSTTTKPPAPKPPTPPVGSIQFTRIQYNAPGKDTNKNASVNGEYFKITNKMRKTSFNLKGWTVRDRAGNLYRFTTNYTLKAGKSVVIKTGKGANTTPTRYWGKKKHVWNNGGDAATLRTNANKTIDTCKWSKPGRGYTNC